MSGSPGVAQSDGAIEDRRARLAVLDVGTEIAFALKLEACFRLGIGQRRLGAAAFEHHQRFRIDIVEEAAALLVLLRVGGAEQAIIETDFALDALGSRHPVNHALDLATLGVLAQGVFVVGAAQLDDVALGILDRFVGTNHVAATQTHLTAGDQALEAGRRDFFEITGINVDLATERQHANAHVLLGMARKLKVLDLTFGIIGDNYLQRLKHTHGARRVGIKIFANGELEHADVHHAAGAVDADHVAEVANRGRRVAATTEP